MMEELLLVKEKKQFWHSLPNGKKIIRVALIFKNAYGVRKSFEYYVVED